MTPMLSRLASGRALVLTWKALKLIILGVVGLAGSMVLLLAALFVVSSRVHLLEKDDASLLGELRSRHEHSGLALIVHSHPTQFRSFRDPNFQWHDFKLGDFTVTPDGGHIWIRPGFYTKTNARKTGLFRTDGTPVWLVDGDRIPWPSDALSRDNKAYARKRSGRMVEIVRISSHHGFEALPIGDPRLGQAEHISWAETSRRLAYEHASVIHIYDLQTAASRPLTEGSNPSWSPDGRWIAYRSRSSEAMLISPDGGERVHLMKGVKVVHGFVWSPDGQYLAFTREYPLSFPILHPIGYLGVYRLRDGARCIVGLYDFKGVARTESYRWIYAPTWFQQR